MDFGRGTSAILHHHRIAITPFIRRPPYAGDGGKRPVDAVVGNRQLSACVLGLTYDRSWVVLRLAGSALSRKRSSDAAPLFFAAMNGNGL